MGGKRLAVACALLVAAALAVIFTFTAGCGPERKSATRASVTAAPERGAETDLTTSGAASDIVHTTRTGKRYHRAGCSSLSRSDIPITRAEAERQGLTPCKVCKP